MLTLEDGAAGIPFSESNATGQKGTRVAAGISFPAPMIASPAGSPMMWRKHAAVSKSSALSAGAPKAELS